jgi:3-dehydroquinate synthase
VRLPAALKLWQTIVAESAKIKARVVAKDERESSLRMILNFGHTVGHAIESLTRYRAYNHGEAVAIGMVAVARIAERLHLISREAVERIVNLLDKVGLPTEIRSIPADEIISALMVDKKVKGGKVRFVLPEKIGRVVVKDNVPAKVVREALEEIGAR